MWRLAVKWLVWLYAWGSVDAMDAWGLWQVLWLLCHAALMGTAAIMSNLIAVPVALVFGPWILFCMIASVPVPSWGCSLLAATCVVIMDRPHWVHMAAMVCATCMQDEVWLNTSGMAVPCPCSSSVDSVLFWCLRHTTQTNNKQLTTALISYADTVFPAVAIRTDALLAKDMHPIQRGLPGVQGLVPFFGSTRYLEASYAYLLVHSTWFTTTWNVTIGQMNMLLDTIATRPDFDPTALVLQLIKTVPQPPLWLLAEIAQRPAFNARACRRACSLPPRQTFRKAVHKTSKKRLLVLERVLAMRK